MSLLIGCPACGARFKAPTRLVGRTVRCLKCMASIVVSADAAAAEPTTVEPPLSSPLPVAEVLPMTAAPIPAGPIAAEAFPEERSTAWLTGLLLAGCALAFLLVVTLLVIVLNRATPRVHVESAPENHEQGSNGSIKPVGPQEAETKPAPEEFPRGERLAELEAKEQEALAPLERQNASNAEMLQRKRKEEDELFKKTKFPGKATAQYANYLKDLAAAVRQINKDTLALERRRAEFVQAKRKLIYDHPRPDDPKLEMYGSLLLTPEEIGDLGKRSINFGSPRAAAQEHIGAASTAGIVATPAYKETLYDPDDADVAVVSYSVASYRGKKAAETQVHIFVHRSKGAWSVLELPGRMNSVLIGPAPSEYLKTPKLN